MKNLLSRFGMVLLVLALSVGSVFAQETTTPQVNSFTFVLIIIGTGIGIVALLGMMMRDTNGDNDSKSE